MAILNGKGVSKGVGIGPAYLLGPAYLSRNLPSRFVPGSVLVSKMTTPDDVPDMIKCVAVVTAEGGMLCHAAIVARELGVPAVVGLGDSILGIKNGQILTVDGNKGTVEYD